MQHNLLSVLWIILILLGTNQCKCGNQPVYDTIHVELQWGDPQPIDLAGLDIKTANGFSCWIPSEKATYFINAADGKTYKFTQEGGALECQVSGNVNPFTLEKSFVFSAGSMEKQNLYFGTLHGGQIIIHQLEEGTWKPATNQNIAPSFPDIQDDKSVVACTIQVDGQQQGCIMFIYKKGPKPWIGCLLFDPAKKILTPVNVGPSYSQGITNHTDLIAALGLNSGKLLLGKNYPSTPHKDSYDILQIEAVTLNLLSTSFKNTDFTGPTGPKIRWDIFSIIDPGVDPAIPIPMFTLKEDNNRYFFWLNTKSDLQGLTPPSFITTAPSLTVPCGDILYVITTRSRLVDEEEGGGEKEEVVYYPAQLVKAKEENTQQSGDN